MSQNFTPPSYLAILQNMNVAMTGWADYLHLSEFPLLEHVVEDLDRVLLGKELKFVEHPCLFTVV